MEAPFYVTTKPPLSYEALRDAIDLCLWAGQLMMQYGAETQMVEETCHRMGTGLGCDWLDVFVSSNAITITASSGADFRTKTRRIVTRPVNFGLITDVLALNRRVAEGQLTREQVRMALRMISEKPRSYPRWLSLIMVGLACAAFSRLFGGDWNAFIIVWIAAGLGTFVRRELSDRAFNMLLVAITTAFTAGGFAALAVRLGLTETPEAALAAAVLLLVPGVPLINGAEDLIKGHTVTGVARGVYGGLISLCIALGLLLAISLLGVQGL